MSVLLVRSRSVKSSGKPGSRRRGQTPFSFDSSLESGTRSCEKNVAAQSLVAESTTDWYILKKKNKKKKSHYSVHWHQRPGVRMMEKCGRCKGTEDDLFSVPYPQTPRRRPLSFENDVCRLYKKDINFITDSTRLFVVDYNICEARLFFFRKSVTGIQGISRRKATTLIKRRA